MKKQVFLLIIALILFAGKAMGQTPQGSLSADGPFCGSSTGHLTWTETAGTGPYDIVYYDGSSNHTKNNAISGTPFSIGTVSSTTTYSLISVTGSDAQSRSSGFTVGSAIITINPLPTLSTATLAGHACEGSGAIINLTGLLASTTYTISYKINSVAQTDITGVAADGSGDASFTSANLVIGNDGQTLQITDETVTSPATGCSSSISKNVTLHVDAAAVGGTVASNQEICSGTSPASLVLTGKTGTVSKWQKSADAGFSSPADISSTSTTLTSGTIGTLTSSTYFRAVVTSGVCTAYSSSVLITVDPVSVGGSASNQEICSGSTPADIVLSSNVGNVTKWQSSSNVSFSSPADIPSSASTTLPGSTIGSLTATTYFRAVVQSGVCSTTNSATVTVTVDPVSVGGTISGSATVCSGTNSTLLTLGGGYVGSILKWQYSTDSWSTSNDISNTNNTYTATNLTATTEYLAVVQSGVCSSANSAPVSVTVNPLPNAITGTTTICAGTTTTLSDLTAGGTWSSASTGVATIDPVTGVVSGVSAGTSLISYTLGTTCFVTTTVTVNPKPVVTNLATDEICSGTSPNLGLTASISSNFAWTIGTNTGSIGGASNSSGPTINQVLTNPSNLTAGSVEYLVSPTSTANSCLGDAFTITITVNPLPTASISPGSLADQCGGGTIPLNGGPAGGTGSYTHAWTGTGNSYLTATNIVNPSFIAPSLSSSTLYGLTYTVTDSKGCTATDAKPVTVLPTASVFNMTATVCSAVGFTVSPVDVTNGVVPSGTTYSWAAPSGSGFSGGATGSGASSITGTLTNTTTSPQTATYTVTPLTGTCTGANFTVTVTLNPAGQVDQPANQAYCIGSSSSVIFSTQNTGGTTAYAWTNDNTSIGLVASGNGNLSFTTQNSTTAPIIANIVVTPTFSNGNSCAGSSKTFTITVNPTPVLTSTLTPSPVCSNTLFSYTPGSATTGTTFNWTRADVTGITPAGPTSGTDNPNETLVNSTSSPIVVTYAYTLTANSCTNNQNVTVVVNPNGQVNQPSNQVVCNNTSTTLVSFGTNNTGGTTGYSWTNDQPGIGLAVSGSGNIAAFTATNSGTAPVIANIVVTPTFTNTTSCVGSTKTFTITVNPSGQVNQPSNQAVCNNASTPLISFSTNNFGGTTTYSWTNDQPTIGLGGSGSGDIAAFTALNSGTAPIIATIIVTPTFTNGNSCSGPTKTFTITVNPTPLLTSSLTPASICSSTAFSYTPTSATSGTSFSWNRATVTGISPVGPTSGTNNPNETLVNATSGPLVVNYVYTLTANSCSNNQNVTFSVNPTPTLTGASQASVICEGASATINLLGLLPGVTSTVAFNINSVPQTPVTGVISNGSGAASFTTPVLTAANNGQYLRVTGITTTSTSPSCAQSFTSDVALSVNALTIGGTVASAQSICSGTSPADLTLSGNTGSVVKWQKSANAGFTSSTDIPETSTTLAGTTIGNLTSSTYFRAVVQSGVCSLTNSASVLITVHTLPTPSVTGVAAVNVNSSGIVYSTETSQFLYNWNVSGAGNTITAGAGTNSITVTFNTAGNQTVSVNYNDGNSCTAATATSKAVHVNDKPVASNITILGDARSGLTLNTFYSYSDADSDPQGTSTFQWYTGTDATGTGAVQIPSATLSSYKLKDADSTKYIGFSVIPVAQSGATPGVIAYSAAWVGPVTNAPPTATSVAITGTPNVNSVLTGHYTFSDREGDIEGSSVYQWYSSSSSTGPFNAISGEIYNTHLIGNSEQGLYFQFSVIPKAATGSPSGVMVVSAVFGPANSQPQAQSVSVSGTAAIGSTLTGSYTYYDKDSDPQGATTFRWLRNGTIPISSATGTTYTLTSADEGYTIAFEVTPVATSGYPLVGTAVLSAQTANVLDPSVLVPVADQVCISGLRVANAVLTGKYNYTFYKSEGTSGYRWLLNNVPISGATSTQYTLTQSDINSGKDITFEVTPKSSNYIPKVGAAVKSNALARIVLAQTNYSLADTAFLLVPNVSGGVFSGVGVSNGFFSPWNADTASKPPHTVKYDLTITNSVTTCSEEATVAISVVPVNAFFVGLNTVYCYDGKNDTIFVKNVPTAATSRTYTSSNLASIVKIIHQDTIVINPGKKRPGIIKDTLSYSYLFNGSYFPISQTYQTDSVGVALINNLDSGRVFCNNDTPFPMYASLLGAGGVFTGPVTPTVSGGTLLDPSKGIGDTSVTFKFTHANTGCFSAITYPIHINPAPKVSFKPLSVCVVTTADTTKFLNKTTSSDPVTTWLWKFYEGGVFRTNGLKNPGYLYQSGGTQEVTLTATTNNGCSAFLDTLINIGFKPVTNFTWKKECYHPNDSILFFDATTSPSGQTITSRTWKFGTLPKDTIGGALDVVKNVKYPKPGTGYLSVKYIVRTNYTNCNDSVTKSIYIRPTIALTATDYFQNFESGQGGWVVDYNKANSWTFGKPNRAVINTAASGNYAWYTSFDTLKQAVDTSTIISPCFDFSTIQRPMISMKLFKRFDMNRDGAVLQYKIEDSTWVNVGSLDDGINWYNSSLIKGKPGANQVGWTTGTTGQDMAWGQSSHTLDVLTGKTDVKFRIAYGSDGTGQNNEGLAFDDIRIGQRTRKVLLEHFTNLSSKLSSSSNTTVTGLATRNKADVINIQYHTNFPGADAYFNDNPGDASARFLFYGLSRAPYSFLDGGTGINYANIYDYVTSPIDSNDLARRSMINPSFAITLNATVSGGIITVNGQIKALTAINAGDVTLYLAVTEKKNTTQTGANGEKIFYNVFRKLIPDAAGISLQKVWTVNDSYTLTDKTWAVAKIASSSDIEVIAFIQNNITKEIYQAQSNLQLNIIVGIDNLPANSGRGFSLYPNPASDKLTISFENSLQAETDIFIYDFKGTIVQTYKVGSGESEFTINDLGLKNGIYLVRIKSGGFDWGFKKLIISKI